MVVDEICKAEALTERHVQAIWYDAAFRPKELFTRRGERVRVLSPGEWNLEAGPDFKRASLEIGEDRRRVVGDVEVHLSPADWDFHHHGTDPNYRNVIAHVTWGLGPIPSTLPPGAVSIWLGRFKSGEADFSPLQIDLKAYPFARLPIGERPCQKKFEAKGEELLELLKSAGKARLRLKAERLLGRLCESSAHGGDRRQVFYEEVLTALGYKANAASFRHLAERVPLRTILSERGVGEEALLAASTFETWAPNASRPCNRPPNRIRAAARLILRTHVMELCNARDFSADAAKKLLRVLVSGNFVGRGRSAAILANVILPFALAEGRLKEIPDWLPPEDVSSPVRTMAFRILGRDANPHVYSANGLVIQGLLHLYHALCLNRHPDCALCSLG